MSWNSHHINCISLVRYEIKNKKNPSSQKILLYNFAAKFPVSYEILIPSLASHVFSLSLFFYFLVFQWTRTFFINPLMPTTLHQHKTHFALSKKTTEMNENKEKMFLFISFFSQSCCVYIFFKKAKHIPTIYNCYCCCCVCFVMCMKNEKREAERKMKTKALAENY